MKTGLFFLSVVLSLSFYSCKEQKSYPDLQPFGINHANIGGEAIDISFLLEKPAGKSGFITVKDGRPVKPSGDRNRLRGVNITDWAKRSVQIPEKNEVELYAKTLAGNGINCVRLQIDLAKEAKSNDRTGLTKRGMVPSLIEIVIGQVLLSGLEKAKK